jgi:hypothetical protein
MATAKRRRRKQDKPTASSPPRLTGWEEFFSKPGIDFPDREQPQPDAPRLDF